MLKCLRIKEGKICKEQYFLGTMLFVGDCDENSHSKMDVVDGQQRLTTITILFSALSDRFLLIDQDVLSKQIFKYIMTKDDNGDDVRIMQSKTHYPFFSFYIQEREKKHLQEPNTEEETCIKNSYKYIYDCLAEDKLKAALRKNNGSDQVDQLKYIDILKALRDQVLSTTFVSISTSDRSQANMIFEILNAKGKWLSDVDLIKNKLFEVLGKVEPADLATEKWNEIKKVLNEPDVNIGFATFYRHFWISKYKKSGAKKLYDDFKKLIKPKNDGRYEQFLQELEENARIYKIIVNPQREDFDNRKEYYYIVQALNSLANYFNIIQVRVALLALLKAKNDKLISLKQLKDSILYLENFHFSYNAIGALPTNRLESIYSKFSINLNACNSKSDVNSYITGLKDDLSSIYITYSDFETQFIKLSYSKKENPSNLKTKYVINKINCYFENDELFSDEGSVEHILPETGGKANLNIGNLILLEGHLNEKAGASPYNDKIEIYNSSKYKWIKQFIKDNPEWGCCGVEKRASTLARLYYTEIMGRKVEDSTL